jgi:hypothetical protein
MHLSFLRKRLPRKVEPLPSTYRISQAHLFRKPESITKDDRRPVDVIFVALLSGAKGGGAGGGIS